MKVFKRGFILFLSITLLSSCASKRNIVDAISDTSVETYTYFKTEQNEELKLDIYQSRKEKNDLPLILYVHGGGFSGGARNDHFIKEYCIEMAKKGFPVVSMSYRLTMKKYGFGCNTDANLKITAFNKASEDISYATKYLLENKRQFNITSDKIILIGSSAGAEAVLNLVYVYENKILPKDFKFAGVIAMAGAITTLDNITNERAIPTQLFHGIKDKLVPYNKAPHHYCKKNTKGYLPLFGSRAIANKLKELNEGYFLYTIKEGNHSWNTKPMQVCKNEILNFINNQILTLQKKQKEVVLKKE